MKNKKIKKIEVAVIFGGCSVEHDISIITGVQTLNNIDKTKFNVTPIYITKEGKWLTGDKLFNIKTFVDENNISKNCLEVVLSNNSSLYKLKGKKYVFLNKIDFVYFALHGGAGENGAVQGVIENSKIPYSCSGVLSSAICMNKLMAKNILSKSNVPTTEHICLFKTDFDGKMQKVTEKLEEKSFKFPLIVKPCSLGSSIGINVCKNKTQLKNALSFAFMFDNCVLIENLVENLREFNVAVMGNELDVEISDVEEVFSTKEFLTFESKYLNDSSNKNGMENTDRVVQAIINEEIKSQIYKYALTAFKVLNCKGIVRIDFLYNSKTQELFLNELNTIPGSLANYLWKTKNYNFTQVLNKLYEYGVNQFELEQKKILRFSTNVLSKFENAEKLEVIK